MRAANARSPNPAHGDPRVTTGRTLPANGREDGHAPATRGKGRPFRHGPWANQAREWPTGPYSLAIPKGGKHHQTATSSTPIRRRSRQVCIKFGALRFSYIVVILSVLCADSWYIWSTFPWRKCTQCAKVNKNEQPASLFQFFLEFFRFPSGPATKGEEGTQVPELDASRNFMHPPGMIPTNWHSTPEKRQSGMRASPPWTHGHQIIRPQSSSATLSNGEGRTRVKPWDSRDAMRKQQPGGP